MPQSRVGDGEIHYELYDFTEPWRSGRPPVVFIHGLGGDHRVWLYQVPAFCAEFPTITVDLRGHGRSSRSEVDFTVADLARDLVRLLRNLGVERVHLVGVSLGGMVAQQFALDYPYAVASLVLADTFCGAPSGYDGIMHESMLFIERNTMAVVAAARITNAFSDGIDPGTRDYFIDQVARHDKQAYTRAARAAFAFSSRDRLHEITAPTLVVVGEEDRVTPAPLSEELSAGIAGAELVRIPGAGHISNFERPREFNAAVLGFLRAQG